MTPARRGDGLDLRRIAAIETSLAAFIAEGEFAGVAFQLARHGRTLHRAVLGFRDLASGSPLAEDTIYRLFSMTKPVIGAAMMVLFERGLWRPEDPIARHLPEFTDVRGPGGAKPDHPPMMRELMTHTAGFGYGVGRPSLDETDAALVAARIWDSADLADFARRVAAVPLAYQPGSAWRYSVSVDLQGAIIERMTGQNLPDFMEETIFRPLGMPDTGFVVPEEKGSRLASLYHKRGTDRLTVVDDPFLTNVPNIPPARPPAGAGLFSTLGDYARFAQMLLNRGHLDGVQILSPASAAMITSNHLPSAIINIGAVAGFQKIGPGRGFGFNGAVIFDPEAADAPVGNGTYQWDGACGVWFWIDPQNDISFVGMTQRMAQRRMPDLQALTQAWVAEALRRD